MSANELAETITAALQAAGNPARAEQEQRYLKSTRTFAGCDVPTCRRITRAALKNSPPLSNTQLWQTVDLLWNGPFFETRRAAVEILKREAPSLTASDLPRLHDLIADGETWAIVDELAVHVIGTMTATDPSITAPTLAAWSTDPSFWVRRSVLLAHLLTLRDPRPAANFDRLWLSYTNYAELMLPETEFFIRKAIGWALRETSKRHPELVRAWVAPRVDRMSGITRREATKYL